MQIRQQSGVEMTTKQTMTFVDSNDNNTLNIGGSMPDSRNTDTDCSLKEFLSRPVKISEYNWGTVQFSESVDPWNALFNNNRISNRISNYKLFRGKVKVNIVINGNGFFYGKLMCSYLPFQMTDMQTSYSTLVPLNRIPMSQCPHVFLDPTTSQGAQLTLPFFYYADYVDLQNSDQIRNLGSLLFYQIAPLKHANQNLAVSGESVTISVFASFEDVELFGPTHKNILGITPQSGTEDETVDKPISQVCTAVASSAKSLTQVPVIGKYALALETGARMTASVASALGFSKPADCVEPSKFTPRAVGNIGITNTTDSSMKLSTDIKQETTIDSTVCGLDGTDELTIANIAKKESFITTFQWSDLTAPESLLFNTYVTPIQFYRNLSPSNVYMTACCGASIPFEYWTGSITFKFQVISSAYHRGRLAIVYDPNSTTTPREDNVAYTEIVDIAETREFEITIGNYQEYQWMKIGPDWYSYPSFSTSPLTMNHGWVNGTLSVFVLNKLTSPNSDVTLNTDISVAVYVKAGDDFQLANPSGRVSGYTITKQSGIEAPDAVGDESAIPIEHTNPTAEYVNRVYVGEKIDSFRTLLKRANGYAAVIPTNSAFQTSIFEHQAYPLFKDYMDDFPRTGDNQCSFTMMNYLMRAFAGWKGGVRWKLVYTEVEGTVTATRKEMTITPFVIGQWDRVSDENVNDKFISYIGPGSQKGAVISSYYVNPILEIEIPFYSRYKFVAGKPHNFLQTAYPAYEEGFSSTYTRRNFTGVYGTVCETYVSAAEDFNLMFFTGFPPMGV